jgi:two-component system OmpR family sensor kinase
VSAPVGSRVSLRARLLAASLALLTFGLLVADVATFSALRSFLYGRVDAQLQGATTTVVSALAVTRNLRAALGEVPTTIVPGVFVQVRGARGEILVTVEGRRPGEPVSTPALRDEPVVGRPFTVPSAERGGPRFRTLVSPVGAGLIIVALPLRETTLTLRRLIAIEVLVSTGVLLAAGAAGVWLVNLGLRPLVDIEKTAAQITAGDMSLRVERDDTQTEVGRLGRALNLMLDDIDAAFAAKVASEQRTRRFVADASHELRTPVAAVRAYAELYRRGADERPEDLARVLSRIEDEAARMGILVDDLLLLTRLDEGRPLERRAVDLGALAADAVEAARAVEPDRPIELGVLGSIEVLGDPIRLRQVVDNLLANVRAHTPAGSPARVVVASDGERAVLEVSDSGPGIEPDDAAHVFERFYRADASRGRDSGGAGLGLSIVAAITTAHGGRVDIANRDGYAGTVIRVALPLLSQA